jgi:SAM-dependent methyltransferase
VRRNIDEKVVDGFGDEWRRLDQSALAEADLREMFEGYFSVFPWERVSRSSMGFDFGCGSGRWARLVAPRVGTLHCIDASEAALAVAARNLASCDNCHLHLAGIENMPLADGTADFGYSLGVLHHVPDTASGIRACAAKLKPGAPFLLYLYYAFDNRPAWYRALWKASELARKIVSRSPFPLRYALSQVAALLVYLPLARTAWLLEKISVDVTAFPLAYYRRRGFYVMRTDALDRFGTRLEQRFTKEQIREMMESAGLENIRFSESAPYWCAVGYRKPR